MAIFDKIDFEKFCYHNHLSMNWLEDALRFPWKFTSEEKGMLRKALLEKGISNYDIDREIGKPSYLR